MDYYLIRFHRGFLYFNIKTQALRGLLSMFETPSV